MPLWAWHNSVLKKKVMLILCSQSVPLFSATVWAQQGTTHFTLPFMVQVFHHVLKESFPQKTLPLKTFSHRSHLSQVCEDCRSSGWQHESERKTVSLEYQVAPLRNCAYVRQAPDPGSKAAPAEGLVLEKQQFRNCLEKLQILSLSLTACDLNTFHFLRRCALSASPGWVIIVIFSSQKTEGEMLIFCAQTSSP